MREIAAEFDSANFQNILLIELFESASTEFHKNTLEYIFFSQYILPLTPPFNPLYNVKELLFKIFNLLKHIVDQEG